MKRMLFITLFANITIQAAIDEYRLYYSPINYAKKPKGLKIKIPQDKDTLPRLRLAAPSKVSNLKDSDIDTTTQTKIDTQDKNINPQDLGMYITAGNIESTKAIIRKYPASINVSLRSMHTPLQLAIIYKKIAVAKLLLDTGANSNEKGRLPHSALELAYMQNYQEGVELLLAHKAIVTEETLGLPTITGSTPALLAILQEAYNKQSAAYMPTDEA